VVAREVVVEPVVLTRQTTWEARLVLITWQVGAMDLVSTKFAVAHVRPVEL